MGSCWLVFAAVVALVVTRLAKAKVTEVGEEEVGRRIQQGYRVQATFGALLIACTLLGMLVGAALGSRDVGGFIGFAVAAVGGLIFGFRYDRAKRRAFSGRG